MSDLEDEIPGHKKSPVAMYLLGIVVFAGATIGLLVWKIKQAPDAPPATTTTTVTAVAESPPPPMYAPPPPPKIEVEEPAPTASASGDAKPGASGASGSGGPNPCAKCGTDAEGSAALSSAVASAAGAARGCYNRALKKGEVSGKMNVSVQVGSNGAVCGASITSDTVGSPDVSTCVLNRFRGRTFPPPAKGCVVVNVPINFQIKQ